MACASCGAAARPGRKFCADCGAALAVTCPACDTPYEPGEKFCGECGAALSSNEPAAVGAQATASPMTERRLVSVMFVDLVGFTAASERRDAEEVRELLTRYFDAARHTVGQYGGVVEKFIGDAVMAVWGTPVAHENDAERAVRAAMDILAMGPTLAPALQARAGVVTGEVAATLDAVGQGMVAGDAVNTASRVQSAAAPGEVLVDAATWRLTESAIAYAEAGEHVVKGKAQPLTLHRALRVVANLGGGERSATLEAAFVGRDREMRLVKDLFSAVLGERRARLVAVTGTAGMGKSRLAWEFEKYVDGIAVGVLWHVGRAASDSTIGKLSACVKP